MQDIHDIRGPILIGLDPELLKIAGIAFGAALLVCLCYLLYRYIKKRRGRPKKELLLLPAPLPAHETALNQIYILSDLMDTDPRFFYFRLTGILKFYLGKRFSFNAPEMTTQELLASLPGLEMDKKASSGARSFFEASDTIKYAGIDPARDAMESDEAFVRWFITNTSTARTGQEG